MKRKKLLVIPLLALTALGMVSCQGDEGAATTPSTEVPTTPIDPSTSVEAPKLKSMRIDTSKVKKEYRVGEKLTLEGLSVFVTFEDGEKEVTDYKVDDSSFNGDRVGSYFIRIVYEYEGEMKSRTYLVNVSSILDNIDYVVGITAAGAKESYKFKESLDLSNLVVTAYLKSGKTEVLSKDDYEVDDSLFNSQMRGRYEIKIKYTKTYTEGQSSETISVDTCFLAFVDLTMESISVSGKSTFYQYDNLDISDWKVTIKYSEGVSEVITTGFKTDIEEKLENLTKPASATVTVSYTYNGKTVYATLNCTVKAPTFDFNAGVLDNIDNLETEKVIDEHFSLLPGISVLSDASQCGTQSFNKCVLLGANGSTQENAIKINIQKRAKIFICVSSDEGAEIGLYDQAGNGVNSYYVGNNTTRLEFEVAVGDTYYFWSDKPVSIYYIGVWQ